MNAHDAVIDAVLAALRRQPAVTTGPIDEDVDRTMLPEGVAESIGVRMGRSRPTRQALLGQPVQWRTDIIIDCVARRDERTPAGRASRRLHQRAYQRLLTDPRLRGVIFDLQEPDLSPDLEQHETRIACLSAVYPVLHETAAGTLEPRA